MSEIDDISARLTAVETVVGQLMTHLAVRSDDPAKWISTRKVLALRTIDSTGAADGERARILDALFGLFHQAEAVAEDYLRP